MTIEQAKKAAALIKELEQLENYKHLLENKNGIKPHFEMLGCIDQTPMTIIFGDRYNGMFVIVVDQIIKSLREELLAL